MARLFDQAVSRFHRLDFAVNNAGIGGPWEPLQAYPHAGWDRVLAVNLTGVFYCMQEEIKRMIGKGGAIVNVASIAGKRGLPYQAAYTASKHAVIGLTPRLCPGGRPPRHSRQCRPVPPTPIRL